ncbi:MAG: alpha/beta hydrolase [Cyclobacteriaceae bacterium]
MARYIKLNLISLLFFFQINSYAQNIKEYFKVNVEGYEFPVFVRGNLDSEFMLLFVQGGYGETAIDFARSDYPKWKKTLEKEIAIAYFDERGLNQKVNTIDTAKITYEQYGKDLLALVKHLKLKYNRKIVLMGHSEGGASVYYALSQLTETDTTIAGSIFLNVTYTSDFSPKRYKEVRPTYLKNIAREFIGAGKDTAYWREALNWITVTDSIHTPEISRKWNAYTTSAFTPSKRKIGLGMAFRVIFSRPYNPYKYLYRKDNELVDDLLWADERKLETVSTEITNRQPVLLVTGRYDDIACPEEQDLFQEAIPNTEIRILPDCGHESFLDQPVLLQEAINHFLESI